MTINIHFKDLTFSLLLFLTFSAIPQKFKLKIVERIFPITNTAGWKPKNEI